jgi:HEAT repeat protein
MPLTRAARPRAPRAATLDHADPAARRLAVADCTTAAPLLALLAREQDGGVRHAILTRLGALEEPGLEAQLVPLLASEDVALRQDAILALRRRGTAALPALVTLLAAPDPDLRIFAANILEGVNAPGARAALTGRLAQEDDAAVCLAMVEALAQIGAPGDAPALAALRARFPGDGCLGFAITLAREQIGAEP